MLIIRFCVFANCLKAVDEESRGGGSTGGMSDDLRGAVSNLEILNRDEKLDHVDFLVAPKAFLSDDVSESIAVGVELIGILGSMGGIVGKT